VQLAYTNDAFTPHPKDVAKARAVIEAMEEVRAKGEAVAMIEGHVITEDVELAARATIELAAM
ncbi:MAG: CoA ester lyase, partial [Anaerolineae bacterium]|nr:CoA ester lyase [Anaerolineae bacterium]